MTQQEYQDRDWRENKKLIFEKLEKLEQGQDAAALARKEIHAEISNMHTELKQLAQNVASLSKDVAEALAGKKDMPPWKYMLMGMVSAAILLGANIGADKIAKMLGIV